MTSQNTLGSAIGIVSDTFEITNDVKEKTKITVKFDFTSVDDQTVKAWVASNRRIALQAQLRKLTIGEIEALDGTTIVAVNAGCKIKSRQEQVSAMTAAGIPVELAKMMIDDPEKFKEVMKKVEI